MSRAEESPLVPIGRHLGKSLTELGRTQAGLNDLERMTTSRQFVDRHAEFVKAVKRFLARLGPAARASLPKDESQLRRQRNRRPALRIAPGSAFASAADRDFEAD